MPTREVPAAQRVAIRFSVEGFGFEALVLEVPVKPPDAPGYHHKISYISERCGGGKLGELPDEWVSLDFEALTFSDQDGHAGVPFTVLSTGNFEQ